MPLAEADNPDDPNRKRSIYPYLPLSSCLKISDAVKDLGGMRSSVQKSLLAKQLGDSEKSSSFSQRITSAKAFGLIDGHGSYALTEASKRYYFPTADSEKAWALIALFATPQVFQELLRRFDGDKLPSKEILSNILHKDLGVPNSWMDRVSGFFTAGAKQVGVVDEQGFLRYKAAQHTMVPQSAASAPQSTVVESVVIPPPSPPTRPAADPTLSAWNFSFKGQTVEVRTPAEIDKALWDKLNAYVQLLKPSD